MNSKVIFVNGTRVSDFLGIKIKNDTKLEDIQDKEEVKDFMNKYSKYLYSNKIEDIKEFYNLTGLMLTHICEIDAERKHIFSMNDIYRTDVNGNIYSKPVYITHILVVTKGLDGNDNDYYRQVFWKNQHEKKILGNANYTLSCLCRSIKSKIDFIEENYDSNTFKEFNKKDIKWVEISLLNNMCILLKNGDLFVDNKLYAKNVDIIWHQDSYNSYIIYKDNRLENFLSEFPYTNIKKYKKVVYNKTMLATLKNKNLDLIIEVDRPGTCIMTRIIGIDDIEIDKEMLYGIVGDSKFKIPTWYNTIVVDNS